MFQVPAQIESVSTRKDRTIKLVVGTSELDPIEAAQIMMLNQSQGWFLFKEDEIQSSEVPKENTDLEETKTPSQRLRAVIFVYWKEKGGNGDFNTFYRRQMEKIINRVKGELA